MLYVYAKYTHTLHLYTNSRVAAATRQWLWGRNKGLSTEFRPETSREMQTTHTHTQTRPLHKSSDSEAEMHILSWDGQVSIYHEVRCCGGNEEIPQESCLYGYVVRVVLLLYYYYHYYIIIVLLLLLLYYYCYTFNYYYYCYIITITLYCYPIIFVLLLIYYYHININYYCIILTLLLYYS